MADKRRLHFGIIFPSLKITDNYNLLENIEEYAERNDINLTAYFGMHEAKQLEFASHYTPCFEAIEKNDTLDGIIAYSGFIAHNIGTEVFADCIDRFSERMPVVSIALLVPNVRCVIIDNVSAMYNAVDHLIKCHGKKRIIIINGPAGHPEAEARLQGYLNALADNGIERDDSLILPGNWTPQSGIAAAETIIERSLQFDAIAATDDDSAMVAMNILREKGYPIPDEISVTGFNDVFLAVHCEPALSTVRQNFAHYGGIAIEALHKIVKGEAVDSVIPAVPEFVIRCSCGCNKGKNFRPAYTFGGISGAGERQFITDSVLLKFNFEALRDELYEMLPKILVDFAIVGLYRDIIKNDLAGNDRSVAALFGLDGERKIGIFKNSGDPYPFSDYSLIEDANFESKRRTLFFLPLFFGDEESGIILIAYNKQNPVEWHELLRRHIAVAVKGASLLETINKLSVTDELTKLLNRRGFYRQVSARMLYLQRSVDSIPVIFALDMDGLKMINDTYGHAEGDRAITAFSNILKDSVRAEDIVGRVGGDEFVIFSVIKSEKDIERLEARIRQKFVEYNALKNHPSDILGSIGACPLDSLTDDAFDRAMLEADKMLYKEKQKKRKQGLARQ